MQGIIFDIKRFAIHDGPGLRTTVFLKGCPLDCWWCHNPEGINPSIEAYISVEKLGELEFKSTRQMGRKISAIEVFCEIQKEGIFMKEGHGGVTLSGGEPLMQPEFALRILQLCKAKGMHTAVDTAGNISAENINLVMPFTDLVLYDIKLIDPIRHKKFIGVDNELILRNFKNLVKSGKNTIVRIPLIPDINLNTEALNLMRDFFLPLKAEHFCEIHLLPYHHIGQAKYNRFNKLNRMNKAVEPAKKDLIPAVKIFEQAGFKVVIH